MAKLYLNNEDVLTCMYETKILNTPEYTSTLHSPTIVTKTKSLKHTLTLPAPIPDEEKKLT